MVNRSCSKSRNPSPPSRTVASRCARLLLTRLAVALLSAFALLSGCATVAPPIVSSGAVDPAGLERGQASFSAEGLVGAAPAPVPQLAAEAALHGDVGLGNRWTLRVDGSGAGVGRRVLGGGRVGLRRSSPGGVSSLGLGVSGGGAYYPTQRPFAWFAPDWEVAVGNTFGIARVGVVLRAGVTLPFQPARHTVEITMSWSTRVSVALELKEGHSLILGVPMGVAVSPVNGHTAGWIGGGVGYEIRFGGLPPAQRATQTAG